MTFVNLHVHSQYSLLDGLCSPKELAARAVELCQPALAITDHGTLAGHRKFQEATKEAGIKGILGGEFYISETDRFDRRSIKKRDDNTSIFNHIILLAKNQTGLDNLNKLSEIAWTQGYYFKPRVDMEVLSEHKDGIIVLSGCMSGLIAKAILNGYEDRARMATKWFASQFSDDFYIEVQPHNPPELNDKLLELADEYGVQPVITSDAHFASPDQRATEEALLILSTHPGSAEGVNYAKAKEIDDPFERYDFMYPDRPISFAKIDVYLQSREEMEKSMPGRTDILDNTLAIADKVEEYDYPKNLNLLPKITSNPDKKLTNMCYRALAENSFGEEYSERLKIELDAIKRKNFSTYFLIQADMINYAKEHGILVGPGRGSSAGSLVCYLLGITQVDPIKYNLLFARFINVGYAKYHCKFEIL